ncbi:hypothetical protein [Alkaliphilus transvaalensis]|uniref:hypothetical protein n=1 Tax=Alkaliphilus transvaalensis TaxID=114628 RepID=UPI00047A79AF|nr:hypothetical protein [Alkaliphilus transvaalensis]
MDFLYECIELVFRKLPISKNNLKMKETLLTEITEKYHLLLREQTHEETIKLLNLQYDWLIETSRIDGSCGLYWTVDNLTLSNEGLLFEPSLKEYQFDTTYQLLKEICGLNLCYDKKDEDFIFESSKLFVVFAMDQDRNYLGSIGDHCNFSDLDIPIGYVGQDGFYGRIANNLKEFIQLSIFYPFWYEIVKVEGNISEKTLTELETAYTKNIPDFYEKQEILADSLKINKNENSLQLLLNNLKLESDFLLSDFSNGCSPKKIGRTT